METTVFPILAQTCVYNDVDHSTCARQMSGARFPLLTGVEIEIGGPCHPTVADDGSDGPAPVAGLPNRFHRFGLS